MIRRHIFSLRENRHDVSVVLLISLNLFITKDRAENTDAVALEDEGQKQYGGLHLWLSLC
jgi:hypothetical protein